MRFAFPTQTVMSLLPPLDRNIILNDRNRIRYYFQSNRNLTLSQALATKELSACNQKV